MYRVWMLVFFLPRARAWTLWYVDTPRPLHHDFPIRIAAEFGLQAFFLTAAELSANDEAALAPTQHM